MWRWEKHEIIIITQLVLYSLSLTLLESLLLLQHFSVLLDLILFCFCRSCLLIFFTLFFDSEPTIVLASVLLYSTFLCHKKFLCSSRLSTLSFDERVRKTSLNSTPIYHITRIRRLRQSKKIRYKLSPVYLFTSSDFHHQFSSFSSNTGKKASSISFPFLFYSVLSFLSVDDLLPLLLSSLFSTVSVSRENSRAFKNDLEKRGWKKELSWCWVRTFWWYQQKRIRMFSLMKKKRGKEKCSKTPLSNTQKDISLSF
jgi:hypothetical protein